MNQIPENYLEKVYAGWLGKIIGVRHGAQTEGWTYEKIQNLYGEITSYPVDYRDFAADDDSNVPLFFLRALEYCRDPQGMTPQDVGDALLNYAPYEHGFFWWGGYGVSTEHTAYLNLRNGIPAPRSGSVLQNGATVAEQIGGQIFIDVWGLVAPGNPELASRYAEAAASVTHGGNGVYGGIFLAVCASLAFVETDVETILEKALTYLPADSEYTRVVRAVMDYYKKDEAKDWRSCFLWLRDHFGYDKYAGSCHIIPNAGVVVLSMLYGKDSFDDTINICNMCGWDTDCNVGNVGCITAVRLGLSAIDYRKWRAPINDFLVFSSVVGSLNLQDIPQGASYIAKLAYLVAGQEAPEGWKEILEQDGNLCHFEYPGSTHAMRVRAEIEGPLEAWVENSEEYAHTGKRSLKMCARRVAAADTVYLYKKTHCRPADFHDSRYDPCFSPTVYPGQTVEADVFVAPGDAELLAQMYVYDGNHQQVLAGARELCREGQWVHLRYEIPHLDGACLEEVGVKFTRPAPCSGDREVRVFLDDLKVSGSPDYTVDFSLEREEPWPCPHREISQFTALKGLFHLEGDELHLSCADFAEMYTGGDSWTDYEVSAELTAVTGEKHLMNARVRGAEHSYAIGFYGKDRVALLKNDNGYRVLCEKEFPWEYGKAYRLSLNVQGSTLTGAVDGKELFQVQDESAYLRGHVGFSCREGSHSSWRSLKVAGVKL